MKTLHGYLAVIALTMITSCVSKIEKTVLNISVNNIENPQFLFFPPERVAPDTLQISTSAPLRIEFDNHGISQVRILYADAYVPLFVEPGQEYNLNFTKDAENKIRFTSDNNVQQQYYNLTKDRNLYIYELVGSKATYDTLGYKLLTSFEQSIDDDCSEFDTLRMSPDLKNALRKDTEVYWLMHLSKIIRLNHMNYVRSNKPMYPEFMEVWEKIYKKYPIGNEYLHSNWLQYYVQEYRNYNAAITSGNQPVSFSTQTDFWNNKYNFLNKDIPDKRVLEKVLVESLYDDCENNITHDKALTVHINNFLKDYPDNPNSEYFSAYLSEIDEYYRIIEKDFSPEVKFIEGYEKLTTLRQAISQFSGKPVFIDFWFSTCGPCISEFSQSGLLKKFLTENGIEMLYVSIDSERMEENWKNTIKVHNLEGYHIRAENILHQDMHKNYGVYMFPHYMIVNQEGEIIVNGAKNPSEGEALIEQIKSSLKIN